MLNNVNQHELKWLVYCRKSTDTEDKQVASLPSQEKELAELAQKSGLKNIVHVYLESCSAFHPGRPDFNDMMAKLYNGEANAVLVWAGNRIARNPVDAGAFIYAMDQGKILAVKTIGSTYYNTPDNKFALSIDFTVSKKSSDDLSEAVLRGNRTKFFDYREWIGPAKQGFINFTEPLTKKRDVKVDQERFDLLQESGKRIISGEMTPLEALDWLNQDMGYRTLPQRKQGGGPLSKTTFYNFLSDSFYYGMMKRKVEGSVQECEHKYPKMFTANEWNVLQIRLGRKSRSKQKKCDFPYKGVMACGECNGFVTADEKWQIICPQCSTKLAKTAKRDTCIACGLKIELMSNPTILHYVYYHCTKKVNRNCTQGYLEVGELEHQIDTELQKFEIDPDFKDWAIKHLGELNDAKSLQDKAATQRNTESYEILKSKLRKMTSFRFTDRYEESSAEEKEAYEAELNVLKHEIESVKGVLNVTDQRQYDWLELSKKTFEFACYARYWFDRGDVKTKTQILQLLGQNLKLYNKKVLVNQDNPFWLIEKGKQEAAIVGVSLEPNKMASVSNLLAYLQPALPTLLRD